MTEAIRDENHIPVALGVSSTDSTATLPFKIDPATGRLLVDSATSSGDVVGPASSTDNAIARFDSTTGKLLQNSGVIIDDSNNVTGVASLTSPLIYGGTATTSDLSFQTTTGVGTTGADMHFLVGNNGATEAMTILNSGNVGIGTSTPSGKLHVVTAGSGNVNFDQADSNTSVGFLNGFTLNNTDATTNNYIGILFGDNSASAAGASGGIGMQLTDRTNHYGDFVIVTRGTGGYTEKLRVDSDGLVSFTGAQLKASGAAAPALINTSAQATTPTLVPNQGDGNTGIGQAASDQLSLIAGGVEGIRITEAGSAISAIDMNGPLNGTSATFSSSITATAHISTNAAASNTFLSSKVTGDTNDRLLSTAAGTLKWGPGNAADDTNLYRNGVGILKTDGAFNPTTIELGHATDTTLSRVSAGVVAIEGVNIVTESATQTLTNKTLGATTLSGTVTGGDQNITGLGRVSFTQELDNGSKTASFSIDFGTDQKQKVTLTANTMTLTLDTTFDSVGNYLLKIVNGGLATLTWASESGSILWAGGAEPTLTSSGTDIISFYYDGTNWYGVASLAFA